MEVVNPIGREQELKENADYASVTSSCKCSGTYTFSTGSLYGYKCFCGTEDPYGTLGTNVNKG